MKFNLFKTTRDQRFFNSDNISYSDNFVFIHIPKNAGTAVSKSFGIKKSKHNTVKEYINVLGEKQYDKMLSFAFVRNPFSRFISLYNYARMEESYYHSAINPEKAIYGKHMDYELLKDASIDEAAQLLKQGKLIHNPPHTQWNSQCFWLKDHKEKLHVKYFARFEDIEFHLRNINNLIGASTLSKLDKINASSKSSLDYKKLLSLDTRKILEEYYREDLETFNYDF